VAAPTVSPMSRLSLPSPRRTVRAGVRVCRRLGYTDAEALVLVGLIADAARDQVLIMGEYNVAWIEDIKTETRCQLARQRKG